MSQISLKKYNQEIRQTIQSGAIERAIAHCRHILSYYPMYLPVYRLLGYVCLEKGDYSYATHFYQSVLSADPEDANAWSRLSVLTDDLGELEQATWLMERAFEVEPGSSEIRGLLRQLYSRRDGVDRPRIKLSAGALARLYAKGGFYQHAVDELEKMIQGTSGLAPLHIAYLEVALAEALWHAEGMSAMADNIARRLLDKLPNCLKANLIAGQIRWAVGMEHEAQKHLQIALAMDPEGYVAYQMFGERSPVPLADVQVPYLEREAQAVFVAQPETGDTQVEDLSWLEQIGEITQAGGTLEPIEDQEPQTMPDWLQAWPSEGEAQAVDVVEPKSEERVSEEPSAPAWLRELQTREEKEPAIPTWLRDIQQESADEAEEATATPDWLSDLRPVDGEAQVGAPSLAPVEEGMESEEAVEEETPDWLMALQPEVEESGLDIVTEEMAVEEGLPDWLTELSAEEPSKVLEPTNDEQSLGKFEEELPDWLAGLAPEAEEELVAAIGMPEEIEPEEELEGAEIPDWLAELTPETEEEPVAAIGMPEEIAPEEELERAEIPDWLAELTPEAEKEAQVMPIETMEEAGPTGVGEIPDWLRELQPQTEIGLVNEIEPELEEELEEVELPGWLTELAPEAEEEAETTAFGESKTGLATEAEIPDWLRELQPGIPTGEQVEPAEAVGEPEFVSEIESELEEEFEETKLPDWLTELSPLAEEEAEVTAFATVGEVEFAGEDEIPDWLRDLGPEAVEETPLEMSEPVKALEEAELPDWLIVPQVEPVAESPVDQATVAQAVSAIELPAPVEEMPNWLVELESEIAGTTTGLLEPVTAPEPETIRSEVLTVTEPQPSVVAAESVHVELPEPMEGMPDWLVELESKIMGMATIQPEAVIEPEGMPEERVSVPEGVEEELPAWLRELQPETEVSVEETAEFVKEVIEEEVELVQEAEIPAWLRELQPETEVSVEETAELV
ncbi:MAG: hypothetical protein JW934_01575, partial [Anaerolineae bacterium]|nr:hypothetical protein [Anaerolineae bacterium]